MKNTIKTIITILLTFLIVTIPFILNEYNFKWYIDFVKHFFIKIDFKDGLSIYIQIALLFFSILGIILSYKVLKFYLKSHNEIMKQNNTPLVTLKVINKDGLLYLKLKNSGNSIAYDINIDIEKTIPYDMSPYKTLNDLPIFKKLSFLDIGEEVMFFFDSAINFYNKPENKELEVAIKINFFSIPKHKRKKENSGKETYETLLSFKELEGLLYISGYGFKEVAKNIETLSHALILNLEEDKNIEIALKEISQNINNLKKFSNSELKRRYKWKNY